MEAMDEKRLELFVENVQAIKHEFKWQSAMLKRLAAFLYAAEDQKINPPAIADCHERIKRSAGVFSSFRGNSAMTIATLLSLDENPIALLDNTLAVYDAMKQAGFRSSDYLVIAACQIAAHAPAGRHDQTIGRAKAFYDGMKQSHRFITSQDDYIFAAMLGISDIDLHEGLAGMEQLFQALRPQFHTGSGVQALSQVLVLGGNPAGAEARVLDLRDSLRSRGMRLDQSYTLSSLGVLALLSAQVDDIVDRVAQMSESLRTRQGFGFWSSVSKQERLLLCAGLVALDFVDRARRGVLDSMLSTSITNIIIAQQAAMAAAAAASASAAAAASSSN